MLRFAGIEAGTHNCDVALKNQCRWSPEAYIVAYRNTIQVIRSVWKASAM